MLVSQKLNHIIWPSISSFNNPKPSQSKEYHAHISPCKYILSHQSLGTGSFSEVYECKHIDSGTHFAVKKINKVNNRSKIKLIQNEFKVLAQMSKPNEDHNDGQKYLLTLKDYFETSSSFYLITDLAVGGDLFDKIVNEGCYRNELDGIKIIHQVVSGLLFLKKNHIIHRDIKAENIFFKYSNRRFEILIGDFGLSTFAHENDNQKDSGSSIDFSNVLCGTLSYMAPEILQRKHYSYPIDVWALGVLMYFLYCGYMPFDCETDDETKTAILSADFSYEPASYWNHVSNNMRSIISSCFIVNEEARVDLEHLSVNSWLNPNKSSHSLSRVSNSSFSNRPSLTSSNSSSTSYFTNLVPSYDTIPTEEEYSDDESEEERQKALNSLRESLYGSLKSASGQSTLNSEKLTSQKLMFTVGGDEDDIEDNEIESQIDKARISSSKQLEVEPSTNNFRNRSFNNSSQSLFKKSVSFTVLKDLHAKRSTSNTSLKDLFNHHNNIHYNSHRTYQIMNGAFSVEPEISKTFRLARTYGKSRVNSQFNSINPSRVTSRIQSTSNSENQSRVQSRVQSRSQSRAPSRRESRGHSREQSFS